MTMAWLMIAATLVVAYVLGSFPTGYLVAKSKGIDIREVGSGSIGATNILRTLGKKAGAAVLVFDVLKGVLAVYAVYLLYIYFFSETICQLDNGTKDAISDLVKAARSGDNSAISIFPNPKDALCVQLALYQPWIIVGAAIAAIVGHSKSVWLGFKGGKSVATSLGVLLAMNPIVGLGTLAVFAITAAITKIVSLSSILGAIGTMILMFALQQPLPYQLLAVFGGAYVIWLHRGNIHRLRKGTEPKIGQKINPS
jgi:acyl phosphate:glycerol-3-phosphate acyltransferase